MGLPGNSVELNNIKKLRRALLVKIPSDVGLSYSVHHSPVVVLGQRARQEQEEEADRTEEGQAHKG